MASATVRSLSAMRQHSRAGKLIGLAVATAFLSIGEPSADPLGDEIALGAKLFADKRLSADGTVSCENCHQPDKAFSDGKTVAVGLRQAIGVRNTPSLSTIGLHKTFSWDGRQTRLESQVLDPLLNPREHGVASREDLVQMIRRASDYSADFRASATPERIASALATYVRSLSKPNVTRFDRWRAGDKNALSENERRGFEVFRGHAGCTSCHLVDEDSSPFTDDQFHSVGLVQLRLGSELANAVLRAANASMPDLELLIGSDPAIAALGRFNVTKRPVDIGKYRTPSLRNVAVTAPYMHDGSIATLEEAVDLEIYYRSIELGRPLAVTPTELKDLVTFLRSLTAERPGRNEGHQ